DENRIGVESELASRRLPDRDYLRSRQPLRAHSIPTATAGRMPTECRSDMPQGLDTCGPYVGDQCGSVEQGSLNGLSRVAATASLLFTISRLAKIVKSLFRGGATFCAKTIDGYANNSSEPNCNPAYEF